MSRWRSVVQLCPAAGGRAKDRHQDAAVPRVRVTRAPLLVLHHINSPPAPHRTSKRPSKLLLHLSGKEPIPEPSGKVQDCGGSRDTRNKLCRPTRVPMGAAIFMKQRPSVPLPSADRLLRAKSLCQADVTLVPWSSDERGADNDEPCLGPRYTALGNPNSICWALTLPPALAVQPQQSAHPA